MIGAYTVKKELLFDGDLSELMDKQFWIDGAYAIRFRDFDNNSFEQLRHHISAADLDRIVHSGSFHAIEGIIKIYKGTDGLRLSYCLRDDQLLVFAFGEYQPARYKLYWEGSWTLA